MENIYEFTVTHDEHGEATGSFTVEGLNRAQSIKLIEYQIKEIMGGVKAKVFNEDHIAPILDIVKAKKEEGQRPEYYVGYFTAMVNFARVLQDSLD